MAKTTTKTAEQSEQVQRQADHAKAHAAACKKAGVKPKVLELKKSKKDKDED
jgi:hypothetical protein